MADYNNLYKQPYYALVTSLPGLVLPLPSYKNVPLNEEELQARLSMMEEKDLDEVIKTVELLDYKSLNEDDQDLKARFEDALETLTYQGLKDLLKQDMRFRTILKALTISCADKSLPELSKDESEGDNWGYDDELMAHIRQNWSHPNFMLSISYPNIIPLRKMIMDNSFLDATNWVEHVRWSHYIEQNDKYEFSVENVALFLVQRLMIKHRLERNAEEATKMVKGAITTMIDKMELSL